MHKEKYAYRMFDDMNDRDDVAECKTLIRGLVDEYNDLLRQYQTLAMAVTGNRF